MLLPHWKSGDVHTLDTLTETPLVVLIQTTSHDPWKPESLESHAAEEAQRAGQVYGKPACCLFSFLRL